MKTLFKVLASGMMLAAFAVAPALAQQEECTALYEQKFLPNYKGPEITKRKTAVEAGEQYIAKCASIDADITKYLEKALPPIKKKIDFEENVEAFNGAIKNAQAIDADVAFRSGKRLLSEHDPNMIDIMIVLASIGFDKAVAKPAVNTYNTDAVNFAKQAIQKIEGGKTSPQYGAYGFSYKNKDNALAWMNYTIGYITYFNQGNKKEGLPYLFKATKFETGGKDNPKTNSAIYQAIGDYYKDEYNRLDDERSALAKQAEGKTPEEAKALADKAKELLLLQKGYAERMIDAYGRAHAYAGTDKAYKDALYDTLKVLYAFRYDNKPSTPLDSYISGLTNKPMPDPTTAVTPVVDTTTTTATTPSTTSSSLTTTPTSTTTTNARTSTTADTTTTKTKTAPKTPAKTPAPKKKGTR